MSEETKSNEEESFDYKFKVLLLGDSNVGKSFLLNRLIQRDRFKFYDSNNNSSLGNTIGVDFKTVYLSLEKSNVKVVLNVYDTSGDEQYRSIAQSYMENVQAFIIFYDVKNFKSFQNCQLWLDEINKKHNCVNVQIAVSNKENTKNSKQEKIKPCDHLIKILVGCKNDIDCQKEKSQTVSTKKAKEFAKKNGFCLFYETSAKDNLKIDDLFEEISMELISNYIKFLKYQESMLLKVSVPCTSKSLMYLNRIEIPLKALISKSDVYFNCKTEKLNCNHIILNNKNSKRKNLQTKDFYVMDLF